MKYKIFIPFLFLSIIIHAQNETFKEQYITVNDFIDGTLLKVNDADSKVLAIIIGDSGPTDRDGNQNFNKSNTLKKLAEGLSYKNINTFRYDKRIVKQIRRGRVDKNIRFDDFITDVTSIIDYFKLKNEFTKIYIIGHSQGSLVGMIAAKQNVDGFISLGGSGKSIDQLILDEIEATVPKYLEEARTTVQILKKGQTTTSYPRALSSMFSVDLQPFMSSWMQYDPINELQQLNIPILIINGTKDLQVSVDEATLLSKASTNSTLKIIDKMNHILVPIEGGDLENSKSYNEAYRKLSPELIDTIIEFLK